LAACIGCLLALQAMIASVGLGMSAASSFGQPDFQICSAMTAPSLDARRGNDTDHRGHRPLCPFCFVAQCADHPAAIGDAKSFPAFAGQGIDAPHYAGAEDRAFAYRLHRTTGGPRGPPPFSV
jgi:hypothetical protein